MEVLSCNPSVFRGHLDDSLELCRVTGVKCVVGLDDYQALGRGIKYMLTLVVDVLDGVERCRRRRPVEENVTLE